MILHLRGSAAKNQKYAEKYAFHEDHLEGIIIQNFSFLRLAAGKILQILKWTKYRPTFCRPEFESAIFFFIFILQS